MYISQFHFFLLAPVNRFVEYNHLPAVLFTLFPLPEKVTLKLKEIIEDKLFHFVSSYLILSFSLYA